MKKILDRILIDAVYDALGNRAYRYAFERAEVLLEMIDGIWGDQQEIMECVVVSWNSRHIPVSVDPVLRRDYALTFEEAGELFLCLKDFFVAKRAEFLKKNLSVSDFARECLILLSLFPKTDANKPYRVVLLTGILSHMCPYVPRLQMVD